MWHDRGDATEVDPSLGLSGEDGSIQRFHLEVVSGPAAGTTWTSAVEGASVGSHPSNDVVLDDRTVSRFHCEVRVHPRGVRVRDLDSRNGTLVDGARVVEAWLRHGSLIRLGQSVIRFQLTSEQNELALSSGDHFGTLVGRSVAMRATFAQLEKAAKSDATVLLMGETGTGKEEAASSIHDASERAEGPFVVLDCGAVPRSLLESELFGHERGAFTGATASRPGVFEAAQGGTVFLDEIGELPLDLQPKLLRVLDARTVQRLGGSGPVHVDARVIAATHRDLRIEVNEGRFRPDLYYRVAVVALRMPPLRERPEDIPDLVEHLLDGLEAGPEERAFADEAFVAGLRRAAWPGNVRELRNHVEQCLVLREPVPIGERAGAEEGPLVDGRMSYAEARRRSLDWFERQYLTALLDRHGGNVSQAARAAGVHRVYLHKLLRRHGMHA